MIAVLGYYLPLSVRTTWGEMVIHGRGLFSVESPPVKALGKETGSDFPDELQPPDCFHDVLMISTLEGTNFIIILITIIITITS